MAPNFKTPEGRNAFRDEAIGCFNGATTNAGTMQPPQGALIALADLGNLEREIAGEKMPHGYKGIREQFLAPNSGMVEFIQKQSPPEFQESILRALASKNGSIAMATLLGVSKIGQTGKMAFTKNFFDNLCADNATGRKIINFDANGLVQNSESRIKSKEERINSGHRDALAGETAIAALATDPNPGGAKFFEDETVFNDHLETVAAKLGQHTLFKDINRSSTHMSLTIAGVSINMGAFKSSAKEAGAAAARFVLGELKNSNLSPEQALRAFQALCRAQYIQGGCTRPALVHKINLSSSKDPNEDDFTQCIYSHCTRANAVAFNILADGSVEINAGMIVTGEFMDDYAEGDTGQNRNTGEHCPHAYGMVFTSEICDPDGNHELKSSMMACYY
jgi:hypothetical protein